MTDRRTVLRTSAAAVGVAALGAVVSADPAQAQPPMPPRTSDAPQGDRFEEQQRAEIVEVLRGYERSLNAGDVAGVMRLYTGGAVMLGPGAPSAVGIDAVRAAYAATFQAVDFDLTFEVAEVKFVSGDWALLRTESHGTVRILASGVQVPRRNHELFVLQKSHGCWRFARYSFSSVLP
jgi:uncharacterized protein (TIGR02246 family)